MDSVTAAAIRLHKAFVAEMAAAQGKTAAWAEIRMNVFKRELDAAAAQKKAQPDLFDVTAAEAGKADGMARGEANANDEWKAAAYVALVQAARDLPDFTTDDVIERMPAGVTTHDLRAMGSVPVKAAKEGLIAKTGEFRKSKRATLHSSPIQVWRSLIHKGSVAQ